MLKRLNEVNDIRINDVKGQSFKTYGRIVAGYDFEKLNEYMVLNTDIPEVGNVYVASVPEMESDPVYNELKNHFYGGMDLEIGYCNGRNSTLNGMEYHKGSEVLVAVTDLMLMLGHVWDIEDNEYDVDNVEVFYVEKGMAIELYSTTLHLSPSKTDDEGFKAVIILPRGTNTPLLKDNKIVEKIDQTLLLKNKWIIAHKDRKVLIDQGAYPGIIGENIELKY